MANITEQARLTILCVTRDAALSRLVTTILSSPAEFELISTPGFGTALDQLRHKADVVLVDAVLLPDDSLLREFKAKAGSIPVIVLLGGHEAASRSSAIEHEANGVVWRDSAAADLRPTIRHSITRRGLVDGIAEHIAGAAQAAAPAGEAADNTRMVALKSSLAVERLAPVLGFDRPSLTSKPHAVTFDERKFLRGLTLSSEVPLNGGSHIYRSACALNCGFHYCGLSATVRDGHIVKIEAASFPDARYQRVCLKGISHVQMAAHADRLMTPLRRVGPRGSGRFEPVSWDEVLDAIAARMRALSAEFGPESLMFFTGSGQLTALNGFNGVYQRLASLLGTSAADATQFGLDSAVPSGIEDTFGTGSGYLANSYSDLPNSRLVLLWGTNPVYSRMNWWPFFAEAQRGGTRLITIDPRYTETANKSDDWLPIQPGTDLYLALGLLREIIVQDWIDHDFVLRHTVAPLLVRLDDGSYLRSGVGQFMVWDTARGQVMPPDQSTAPMLEGTVMVRGVACRPAYALLRDMVEQYTPDVVAAKTGVPADRITALAHDYATTRPARIYTLYGVDRWHHGATFGRLIATLAALTGNVGVPGGGAGVDGFCDGSSFISTFPTPDGKQYVPVNPAALPAQILSERPNPIKMVWVAFSNWLNQWPDQTRMRSEIIPKLDLLVVTDTFLTETARWADYVLPAANIFEREDMVKGPDPYVQYQPAFMAPPGECRSDFDIARGVAARFGLEHWFADPPSAYLAQILSEQPGGADLSFETLRREGVLLRPLSDAYRVAHVERQFATSTGRAEFYVERLVPYHRALPAYEPPIEAGRDNKLRERFPLVCITQHSLYRVHSTFVNAPWLREMEQEPHALLNPSEAAARQVEDNDLVRVFNERGYVVVRTRLDDSVPPGTVYFTQGWQPDDFIAGHPQTLTHDQTNPHNVYGPNSSFSDVLVEIVKEQAHGAD
ncbi:MAG TPA: molybdopterin-dependent oxidoreductase [Aggregatilinea sp.]|uniref:molybdopterin-dependent oxidoreductase n=1 Tax=Aggregatilinea sp. TaxID=2806333 RepID=UPI002B50DDF3|nr:molybdopterin-dependent oxidoreductase [Aggregatilinea sp.]HML23446.1 molybdopterin-dependent oxidoreductase [Aggregatilinea sp.]